MEDYSTFFQRIQRNANSAIYLQRVTCIKIVERLWRQQVETVHLYNKAHFTFKNTDKEWQQIVNQVKELAKQIPLPKIMINLLLNFVEEVGHQILKWARIHYKLYKLGAEIVPNKYYWTARGVIDEYETAKMIIANETISKSLRLKLACIYSVEKEVAQLRRNYYVRSISTITMHWANLYLDVMQRYHTGLIRYEQIIMRAISFGNKHTTKYLFKELTVFSRRSVLRSYLIHFQNDFILEPNPEIFCFLLANLNSEQQNQLFNETPHYVLEYFQQWPWCDFFGEVLSYLGPKLTPWICWRYSNNLAAELIEGNQIHLQLMELFWSWMPISYRRYVITKFEQECLLTKLFDYADERIIRFVVNDAKTCDKEFIFSQIAVRICKKLIVSDKWDKMKLFFLLFVVKQEAAIAFKNSFLLNTSIPIEKQSKLIAILDDVIKTFAD